MENITINGKVIDLSSYSIDELKELLDQSNKDELEIKKELSCLLDKLNEK